MFSSLSTLFSSTNISSSLTSSATTKISSTAQNQSVGEKIPLTSKEKVEKKLASILTQIQQNQIKRLNLTSASMGRFYELAHTLRGYKSAVCSLTVLKNGALVSGSGSPENAIKLWDLTSHSCISTLQGHTDCVWALATLPNSLLASGSSDHTIKLWDLTSHSCVSTLQGHTSSIWALAVLPNGQLASGSVDNTIKLWDLASHSCLLTLQGYTGHVGALTALPNGLLASGSIDNTIKLWDLASRSCLFALQGHTDYVGALAVLPNGLLVSGSNDETIKVWEPKTLPAQYLKPILKALRRNTSITYLDLSGNQDILDNVIDPLIHLFKRKGFFSFFSFSSKPNTSLKTIDLRRTGVSQKGVRELERAIQHQQLSIEVLSDCPVEWMMIYFLIIFCRANRNSPFADSGLDLAKYGEVGLFLGVPSGFFSRSLKNPPFSKRTACSPN